MSCSDFIGNLEGLNGGTDFPKELLKVNSVTTWSAKQQEQKQGLWAGSHGWLCGMQ